ncbi:MAG: tetratricopeptide repeat protein [Trueperaceae bacterium]|nr:tetratricopeptide repeat protein [Trueperaceae bacterium]
MQKAGLWVKLLGIPSLEWEGETLALPSPKNLAILAYLAFTQQQCERSKLLELFWQAGKASNLRFALHKLRELQGAEAWLVTEDKFVQVKTRTDLAGIEQALKEGQYLQALAYWQEAEEEQTLLKGLELKDAPAFQNWLELERSRLNQLYLEALQQGIDELERGHKLVEALELAKRLLAKDKLNETAHRAIMRLEHKLGHTEAALAQFETCRQILQEELGVEPLEDTLSLLREIENPSISSAKRALILGEPGQIPGQAEKLLGRADLLQKTLTYLQQDNVLLQGFAGSGKTALAAAVAASYLQDGKKVLWLQAGDDSPESLYDAIARTLDAQKPLSQQEPAQKASFIGTVLEHKQIDLLVLDDVWNAYSLSKIRELMPARTVLLVTSRQRYPGLKRLEVGRLSRQAALELLSYHVQQNLQDDDAADKLCESLSDHAFALRIAGITLALDVRSPASLLEQLKGAPHTLKIPEAFHAEGRETVAALLNASLEALSEEAYEAFMTFGVLYSSSVTPELIALCARRPEAETEKALIELQKRGLSSRHSEPGSDVISYQLHDIAYSFAKDQNHYRSSSAEWACGRFLAQNKTAFPLLDAEMSNLLGAAEAASQNNPDLAIRLMKDLTVGNAYYLARGHSPRSLELLKTAIKLSKQANDLETAHYLVARLGDTYRTLHGNHKAALAAFREALELAQHIKDGQREVVMLTLIGTTLANEGKEEGESYLHKAHALAQQRQDDRALCQVLEHLGCLAGRRGDFTDSLTYFKEGLEAIDRLSQSSISQDELLRLRFFTLLNLAETEKGLKAFTEALATWQTAKGLAEATENQLWLAYSFQGLAETHHDMGQRDRAIAAYQQAYRLFEQNQASADLKTVREAMQVANYPLPDVLELAQAS